MKSGYNFGLSVNAKTIVVALCRRNGIRVDCWLHVSLLAKVVPYFPGWLHGGGVGNPDAFEMQVSPSSLDRIFYGWIFWKAYGWNCAQKVFFFEFFSEFFLSHPKSGWFFENRKNFTYFGLATFVSSKHIIKTLLIESIDPQLSKNQKKSN